jgi:GTPase SAR1 family protein
MVATQGDLMKRIIFSTTASLARVCFFFAAYYDPNYDKRTQGIEIRLLEDSKDMHVAVWDMAGQDEYHALHDSHYMFPDINPSVYVLVSVQTSF